MSLTCLVTGANGHLGQHVVQALLKNNYRVKAGVRQPELYESDSPDLTYCHADMLSENSMNTALQDVDVLIHCAAVFKHWAKDPQQEIVEANIDGTRITLEVAAKHKVKKVVYVSSVAAVGHRNGEYLDEAEWNEAPDNPYYHSKIASEKLAWQLSDKLGLDMVSVLPSAMLGPVKGKLTDTMNYLNMIYLQRLPVDPSFYFNFVDVRDVAEGAVSAINAGRPGERYILSNNECSDMTEILSASKHAGLTLKQPKKIPKMILWIAAAAQELVAKLLSKPAELTRSQVNLFYQVQQNYDHSKAKKELGFQPRQAGEAIRESFEFFKQEGKTS